jgi:hypothetical protein
MLTGSITRKTAGNKHLLVVRGTRSVPMMPVGMSQSTKESSGAMEGEGRMTILEATWPNVLGKFK